MAIVIPPGFGQLTFHTTLSTGGTASTVLGFDFDDVPTQAELDAVSTNFATGWKTYINSGSRYTGVRMLIGQDGGPPTVLESTSGNGVGARGSALSSPQVMALIRKSTNLASRHGIGRVFVPNVAEAGINDDGSLGGAELTALGVVLSMLQVLGGVQGWTPVILHSDGALAPTTVLSWQAETKVATLRSRYHR